jgi:hypothetical protein
MIPQYDSAVHQITLDAFTAEGAPAQEDWPMEATQQARFEAQRKKALEDARVQQLSAGPWRPEQFLTAEEADRRDMLEYSITYEDGTYRLGAQRYARLDQALSSARLRRMHGQPPQRQ